MKERLTKKKQADFFARNFTRDVAAIADETDAVKRSQDVAFFKIAQRNAGKSRFGMIFI